MNPLLSREIRARWRDGRAFGLVFFLAAGLSLFIAWIYRDSVASFTEANGTPVRWAQLGHNIFAQLAWIQTLAWLLVSPALTSSAIAYERERGWFDALILSPLLPRQISVGKWGGALLYAALLYLVTLPCTALTLLMGGVAPEQFWLVVALHALCACFGAALGLATSSWNLRSHVALRSAYGLILIWLLGSWGGATWSGRTSISRLVSSWGGQAPTFWEFLGRTNPVLCANEINGSGPQQNWPLCFAILGLGTVLFLGLATYFSRRPLEESPFVEVKRKPKKGTVPASTHGEIPLVALLSFQNPVLNREFHSKFRMRQPPLMVIVVEAVMAVLVGGFYLKTLYWAWFEPRYRMNIWFGMILTGMIVTMMAAGVMGANGFSREREAGTWEGLRLSLLEANEILKGKIVASILSCILFSFPVWPLLLPCIAWLPQAKPSRYVILPQHAIACGLIWLGTIWSFTMVGLLVGRKQKRSSRASGQTLGILAAFIILSPFLFSVDGDAGYLLGLVHPFIAMGLAFSNDPGYVLYKLGLPFFICNVVFSLVMWVVLVVGVEEDLSSDE